MPKQKTHSGTKDRIRVTKLGKVMRQRPTGNHFLRKKSAARKRRIAIMDTVTGLQKKSTKRKLGV